MKSLSFQILGVGCWGPGFQTWPELQTILLDKRSAESRAEQESSKPKGPKPEIIPANERRRAPLSVRLAVEASWQATQDANIAPEELPSVFVSGIGDTQLTDYMCKALVGENKALSPTKFHNSVHNAAAGYWTISTGCMQAANSVAGFQESVSLALMEAILQCELENRPVLLTFYDAPSSDVLRELLKNESAFSASIIIGPSDTNSQAPTYSASLVDGGCQWSTFQSSADLESCYLNNPSAKILCLLQSIAKNEAASKESVGGANINMPISRERHLQVRLKSRSSDA